VNGEPAGSAKGLCQFLDARSLERDDIAGIDSLAV